MSVRRMVVRVEVEVDADHRLNLVAAQEYLKTHGAPGFAKYEVEDAFDNVEPDDAKDKGYVMSQSLPETLKVSIEPKNPV